MAKRQQPRQLEDVSHGPEYYTKDWQACFVYTLRDDVRIEDCICGFEHRDLSSVAGGRRP